MKKVILISGMALAIFSACKKEDTDSGPCTVISGFSTSQISPTSIKLSWEQNANVSTFQVKYKVYNSDVWKDTVVNTNSVTLINLTENTFYDYQIRGNCLGGGNFLFEKTKVPTGLITGTKTLSVPFDTRGTKPFTFFRFSDSSIVSNTDSASNQWDFGMRFANIIINKGGSRIGEAGVILQNGLIEEIKTVSTTGYAYDTTNTQTAIKDYTSWATYSGPPNNSFTPIAGKVFLFRTGDGEHYAKLEFLNVSYGPFAGQQPTTLLYRFRYTYQSNGSINF